MKIKKKKEEVPTGLGSKVFLMLEISDMYKDYVYFFKFVHEFVNTCILAVSMILPFALSHIYSVVMAGSLGLVHSFMMYFGIVDNIKEHKSR